MDNRGQGKMMMDNKSNNIGNGSGDAIDFWRHDSLVVCSRRVITLARPSPDDLGKSKIKKMLSHRLFSNISSRFVAIHRFSFAPIDFSQWRYRSTGCYVNPSRFQAKFEKQITKMASHKHGIPIKVQLCGSSEPREVNIVIKKKKQRFVTVDHQRNVALASTIYPHVCDIFSSGELGEEFTDLKITLTRLEVASNFSALRVHYASESSSTTDEKGFDEKLRRMGEVVRESLAQMGLLPTIPPVVFVVDKAEQERRVFDRALASIDLGSDYVPAATPSSVSESSSSRSPSSSPIPPWVKLKMTRADYDASIKKDIDS